MAELHAGIVDGWRRELPLERFEAELTPHLDAVGPHVGTDEPIVGRRGPGVRMSVRLRFEGGALDLEATVNSARGIMGMSVEPAG